MPQQTWAPALGNETATCHEERLPMTRGTVRAVQLSSVSRQPMLKGPRRRAGAVTVEFAITAPLFFIFVFSIIEFGRTFMVMELLTDSARVACRQGIVPGTSTKQIKDAATGHLASVGINGDAVTVTINDGVGNITEAQTVPSFTEITVHVSVGVTNVSWLSFFVGTNGTLSGQWTMRRE